MDALFLSALSGDDEIMDNLPVVCVSSAGDVSTGTLVEQVATYAGRSIALVMPARFFSFFSVDMPTVKPHWLRQAVSYALEDLVAEAVEEMHFAIGQKRGSGSYDVIVIRKSVLKLWLRFLETRGVFVDAIYADADLLPKEGDFLLCRDNLIFSGLNGVRGSLGYEEYSAFEKYLAGFAFLNATPLLQESLLKGHSSFAYLEDGQGAEAYSYLAANFHLGTDVAQGTFSSRKTRRGMGVWKGAFFGAALSLLAWVMFNYLATRYMDDLSSGLYEDSLAIYKRAFPEDRRIVNLRAQLDSHLNGAKGERRESILSVISIISAKLETIPSLELVSLVWNEEKGEASLGVKSSEFSELELLRKRLVDEGYSVLMGSASKEEGKPMAQFSVSGFGK